MGAGASSQYAMAAANEECTRPYDGSDITDLNAARNEVARLRQTIQRARNQQLTPVMLDLMGGNLFSSWLRKLSIDRDRFTRSFVRPTRL